MPRTTSNYYSIDTEKLAQIAYLAGTTIEKASEFTLADWPEGQEHQTWLDSAPAQEIASWIDKEAIQ